MACLAISQEHTLELNLSKARTNGTWHQVGVLNTKTEFARGLVTRVDDISAVYAVAGYQDSQWSLQTGLKPLIVGGSVGLTLPTSVDKSGNQFFREYNVNVRNHAEYFANITRSVKTQYLDLEFSGNVASKGNRTIGIKIHTNF